MLVTSLFLFLLISIVMGDGMLLYEPNMPDYRISSQSLFDKLAPDPTLSTFMDVLTQVEDVFELVNASTQAFTIFCPVNTAFHDLDIYSKENLDAFLKNHVVLHKLDVAMLKKTQTLTTMLNEEPIQVHYHRLTQRVILNEHAKVNTEYPVEAIEGIAYKIDQVLRPTPK